MVVELLKDNFLKKLGSEQGDSFSGHLDQLIHNLVIIMVTVLPTYQNIQQSQGHTKLKTRKTEV